MTEGTDSKYRTAVLLAVIAAVAALVAWRASLHSDEASDTWQRSMRAQVKHDAAVVEDVRYALGDHGYAATAYTEAEVRARAYGDVAGQAGGAVRQALQVEGDLYRQLAQLLGENSQIINEGYTEGDRLDLGRYLADVRNTNPDLVGIDADAIEARADDEFDKGVKLMGITVLLTFAFALGALAQGFAARRGLFSGAATVVLMLSAIAAVVVEVS